MAIGTTRSIRSAIDDRSIQLLSDEPLVHLSDIRSVWRIGIKATDALVAEITWRSHVIRDDA